MKKNGLHGSADTINIGSAFGREAERSMTDAQDDKDQAHLVSEVLPEAIKVFRKLDPDGRHRLLRTLGTLFAPDIQVESVGPVTSVYAQPNDRFSRDRTLSPKEFLLKKQPRTEVERVACLGYYLAEYRQQMTFKTLDISKLNTEAAQSKLSNPTRSVENATRSGFLAQATKGAKQLSALGEKYVEGLPDREAAASMMAQAKPKKKPRPKRKRYTNGAVPL